MADKIDDDHNENRNDASDSSVNSSQPLVISAQYIKDLSFESPGTPEIYLNPVEVPNVEVQVNVTAQNLGNQQFESCLQIEARANKEDQPIFIVDLTYACVANIGDVEAEHIQPLILIEAPRLMFPFARTIVAGTTRDGGFQPLMINPIDFVDLYRQRISAHGGPN